MYISLQLCECDGTSQDHEGVWYATGNYSAVFWDSSKVSVIHCDHYTSITGISGFIVLLMGTTGVYNMDIRGL